MSSGKWPGASEKNRAAFAKISYQFFAKYVTMYFVLLCVKDLSGGRQPLETNRKAAGPAHGADGCAGNAHDGGDADLLPRDFPGAFRNAAFSLRLSIAKTTSSSFAA